MNMRKIIAVLSAVLMLCAIIPMGALSVSAATAILDSNFDDGTTGSWKWATDDTVVAEDGAMKWTTLSWKNLYHNFTATAGKDYKLTFKMKCDSALTVSVKFLNGSWGTSGITEYTATNTADQAGTWVEHTYIFNSGSYGGLVLLLQSHKATDIYMDDFLIEEYVVPVDPVFPENAIYVETFETATASGWSSSTSSIAETADLAAINAEGGNYAMQFVSPNYSYTNYQLTVEPNTDYKVTFSILSATSGYPINARIRGNGEDLALIQYTPSTTAWETHSYTFNSGDYTSVGLRFQAAWTTGTYYIDNISVAPFDRSAMANDGHVLNGNFETGDDVEWNASANTEVIEDPTGAGQGYVIHTTETANVNMFSQEFKNLAVGKEYTLSFKVYGYSTATDSAFWVRLPKAFTTWSVDTALELGTANSGAAYTARINVNSNTGAWHDVQLTFTAQATTALIQFMNYRTGQGFYYFDDVTLSHAYDAVVTEPDCTEAGYTTYTCACGDTYTEAGAAALGHSWVDATCTDPKTCSVCGETEGEALGHTAGAEADCENAQTCTVCGEVLNAALDHDWADATCTAPKTCNTCGATEGEALGHTYVGEVTEDATCELTGTMTYTCSVCSDSYTEEIPAWHNGNLTHVPAVEAIDCANPGHIEYYTCPWCNEYFTDANASEMINPWYINITVECVKPESVADCANWTCETCGTENYGAGEHDTGVPACQDGHCSKCDQDIAGFGCANYDTPACEDGVCYYCGGFVAGFGHENGAWAPCQVGECSYGCGLTYPATADHVDEDGDDYCDTCWSHLNHDVDPCVGGECSICWTYIEGAHAWVEASCDNPKYCSVCGETEGDVAHGNIVHVEALEPTCTALGNVEYWYCETCGATWLDEAMTQVTNQMSVKLPMAEHEYFYPCDPVCMNCYEETNPDATHTIVAVEAVEPTCTTMGNIAYWYCSDCGAAWADEACTQMTNQMSVKLPMAEHEYFYPCDGTCMNCYELTNPDATHTIVAVEAVEATCTENGNIAYWYCSDCGSAWADEACTQVTNRFNVIVPAIGEHTYSHEYDVDCDSCGEIREVVAPITKVGTSASEDVSGVAVLFSVEAEGLAIVEGTECNADYDNAYVNGYKLIGMGAEAANYKSSVDIPCVYLWELADNSYAVRIKNIPADKLNENITFTPYVIVEIDGVATTIYGEAVTTSYNAVMS